MVTRIGPSKPTKLYIAEWREKALFTQEQLANRVGTTKSSISRWETGERDITLGALGAIADALGREVPDLYRHPDQPTADELMRDLDEPTRRQAIRLIEALKTGTEG